MLKQITITALKQMRLIGLGIVIGTIWHPFDVTLSNTVNPMDALPVVTDDLGEVSYTDEQRKEMDELFKKQVEGK